MPDRKFIFYIPRIADGISLLDHHTGVNVPFTYNTCAKPRLLRLLHALLGRYAVKPKSNECQPPSDGDPDATNPNPSTANLPTPRPLVVSKVPDCNLPLLIDVCDERSAVVDTEIEDTVLVRGLEVNAEEGGVRGFGNWRKIEAVEGRQHAELELDVVVRAGLKRYEAVVLPFRDLDFKGLHGY